jgi:hypothetical protein
MPEKTARSVNALGNPIALRTSSRRNLEVNLKRGIETSISSLESAAST